MPVGRARPPLSLCVNPSRCTRNPTAIPHVDGNSVDGRKYIWLFV